MPEHSPEQHLPILSNYENENTARAIASIALQASEIVGEFSTIERVPRYANGHRENDAEHSLMLSIVAPEVAHKLDIDLDLDKVRRFAICHDILELKVGDVATFDLTPAQLDEKKQREQAAMHELLAELPTLTAQDLVEYEKQDTKEAIFVRMVDKLLPVAVDITGDGVRVVQEDFDVTDIDKLVESHATLHSHIAEKFQSDFPDLVAAHAVLCEIFEAKFVETVNQKNVAEKMRSPTEIELKYLVDLDKLPESINLNSVRKSHLRQGYIAIGSDGSETRVRSFDDERFELTIKTPGMISRGEQTIKLSREMFDGLWIQTTGMQIEKTRYYIPHGEDEIELDIYEGPSTGLVTAEVEFKGRPAEGMIRAATFEPPEWFGENISENLRYKNQSLAQHGIIEL